MIRAFPHLTRIIATAALILTALAPAVGAESLIYHDIRTDQAGRIVPWAADEPSEAYDQVLGLVWKFWVNLESCSNGVPYFYQHQVWNPKHDPRGIGGDQFAMALSSLNLYYGYTGDPGVRDMMVRMADYYLAHGFSAGTDAWANLPYPYNMVQHSGIYDGDMRAGAGVLQPDKAGSFGAELVMLYEMTGTQRYLAAAELIADTLAAKVRPGDADHSPWPFRVRARTGEPGPAENVPEYTANWTGTLRLFDELIRLNQGQVARYAAARDTATAWLKKHPMKSNKWGPFFEDVKGWSNTEINADTLAWYVLEHPRWADDWAEDSRAILDWSFNTFATNAWAKYDVFPIREQSVYLVPGNSHTARHASVELLYAEKTGDTTRKAAAIRQLNWATYMVDFDGKNRYPRDGIWLTDGYGDYVRHYLRAMAAAPELAPASRNHLLRSSSVIRRIEYQPDAIRYETFDKQSRERLRVARPPVTVALGGTALKQVPRMTALDATDGYYYEASGPTRGLLEIRHSGAREIVIGFKN